MAYTNICHNLLATIAKSILRGNHTRNAIAATFVLLPLLEVLLHTILAVRERPFVWAQSLDSHIQQSKQLSPVVHPFLS